MKPVDYDLVAPVYNERYSHNRFDGLLATLLRFIGASPSADVAEVGCGTGHWCAELAQRVRSVAGLDRSRNMLDSAESNAPSALLVCGAAETLPWRDATFDRVVCINALHHFADKPAFFSEARRVLRMAGGLLTIGLDPHTGLDTWWVYDYFPAALVADRERYLSSVTIRALLAEAGFAGPATEIAQHIPAAVPFAQGVERGMVDRRSTSQLMVIGDAEYESGIDRMRLEQPVLCADLRLFATVGWVA